MAKKLKLLFLGLSGVDGLYVRANIANKTKRLSTFEKLGGVDTFKILRSLITEGATLPHPIPTWSSIYSGLYPDQHQMVSNSLTPGEQYYNHIHGDRIWERLSKDYSVGIFNLPLTYPTPKTSTFSISGFPFIESKEGFYTPNNIRSYLPERYISDVTALPEGKFNYNDLKQYEAEKVDSAIALYKDFDLDVFGFGLSAVDRAGQMKSELGYELNNKLIHKLLKAVKYDHLIMCSDYGFNCTAGKRTINAFCYNSDYQGFEPKDITHNHQMILNVLNP